MEKDCVVVNLLPGTPAENYLQKGDYISTVDGKEANKLNVIEMIIGDDKPGSFVRVGYTRDNGPVCHNMVVAMLFAFAHFSSCQWVLAQPCALVSLAAH